MKITYVPHGEGLASTISDDMQANIMRTIWDGYHAWLRDGNRQYSIDTILYACLAPRAVALRRYVLGQIGDLEGLPESHQCAVGTTDVVRWETIQKIDRRRGIYTSAYKAWDDGHRPRGYIMDDDSPYQQANFRCVVSLGAPSDRQITWRLAKFGQIRCMAELALYCASQLKRIEFDPRAMLDDPYIDSDILAIRLGSYLRDLQVPSAHLAAAGIPLEFDGLHVCEHCGGHATTDGMDTCMQCTSGIVGPGDHPARRWAEYFHRNNCPAVYDGYLLSDAARAYYEAGFEPGHASVACTLGWPASSGIVKIEEMRRAALRDVKVELISRPHR